MHAERVGPELLVAERVEPEDVATFRDDPGVWTGDAISVAGRDRASAEHRDRGTEQRQVELKSLTSTG
jgi:hypothetical protein